MALRGISITVVTPPLAAARVPVQKPSHSVRPGSFKCTCASTRPGRIMFGEWSMYTVSVGNSDCGTTSGRTERIFPVAGDIVIVAGETTRLPCASGMTALVETRTVCVTSCVLDRVVGAISGLQWEESRGLVLSLLLLMYETWDEWRVEKTRWLGYKKAGNTDRELGITLTEKSSTTTQFSNQTGRYGVFYTGCLVLAGRGRGVGLLQAIRCLGRSLSGFWRTAATHRFRSSKPSSKAIE